MYGPSTGRWVRTTSNKMDAVHVKICWRAGMTDRNSLDDQRWRFRYFTRGSARGRCSSRLQQRWQETLLNAAEWAKPPLGCAVCNKSFIYRERERERVCRLILLGRLAGSFWIRPARKFQKEEMKWKQILISSGRVQHGVKVWKEKRLSAFTFVINKLLPIESIPSYLFKIEKKGRLMSLQAW